MATRSLGSLTIDLVSKIGGFTRGMTEAERAADRSARSIAQRQKKAAQEVEKAWKSATGFIAGAFAGLSVAGLMTSFIRETVNSANEQAQLAAALKSTGEAAGFTAQQLNAMAESMSGNSVFSAGEINNAQTRLLAYTNIVGEQFPEAMQAVIDMSARLGMSVEQSAETIGKALDVPSQGLTALSRQGFRFTEEQKKAVEQLERTGQTAKAQAVVLDALKSSYGGAAEAARNTLGGALAALKNQLNTVMTGDSGSLEGVRTAVEQLTTALKNPEIQKAINNLMTGVFRFAIFSIDAVDGVVRAFNIVGKTIGTAAAQAAAVMSGEFRQAINIGKEWAKEVDAILMRPMIRNAPPAPAASAPASGGTSAPTSAEIAALAKAAAAREAALKAGQEAAKQAQSYLENLRKQLQATEDLTVAETVRRDIEAGRVKLAGGVTKQQLLDIATQIDLDRELVKIQQEFKKLDEEALERKKALAEAGKAIYDATRTPAEQLNIELAKLNDLLAKGAIDWDTYGRAVFDAQDKFDAATKGAKDALSDFDKFREKALEGLQQGIAGSLYDIMQGDFKNIGKGFKQMIDRMVAEWLAAQLMMKMFGKDGKGGEGSWFGGAIKWLGGLFGSPGRAAGGVVNAGGTYRVNETGPEMLEMSGRSYLMMGNRAGKVVPAGQSGGNMTVQVSPPAGMSSETAYQYGRRIGAGIQVAMGRNG